MPGPVGGPAAQVEVTSVDGTVLPGQIVPILDVPSLAVATGAANVRVAFAIGESAGRRRGGPARPRRSGSTSKAWTAAAHPSGRAATSSTWRGSAS
ncbi:hypothetical protein [Planomonospora sp. ID91781]|uniref:hypothetical protein n=1 Tax=Planomonospora sp. ID91781 TaxID=2738135 RepID=UPI0018C44DE8|nr:hypothetical protein [Planomonospora sp. ID91781]